MALEFNYWELTLSSLHQPFLTGTGGMGFIWHGQVREHNGPRELEFLQVAVPCAFAALGFETFLRVAVASDPVLLVTVGLGAGTIPGAPVWAGAVCGQCPGWVLARSRSGRVSRLGWRGDGPRVRGSHQGWSQTPGGH